MNLAQTTRSFAIAVLAITTLSAVTSSARADATDGTPREVVSLGDLNLETSSGVRTLYARIHAAAEKVCGPSTVTGTRIVSNAWKDCVNEAVRHAVLALNKPRLTAYYSERLGFRPARTSAVLDQ